MTTPPWGSNTPGYPPGPPHEDVPGYPPGLPQDGVPGHTPHSYGESPVPPPPNGEQPIPPQGHSAPPAPGYPAPLPGYPASPQAQSAPLPPGHPAAPHGHPTPPPGYPASPQGHSAALPPSYPTPPPGYPSSPQGHSAPPLPGYPAPPPGYPSSPHGHPAPPHGQPAPPPGYPQHPHAAPPGYSPHPAPPPLEFPGTPAVQAYLTAVTHHMTRGRMQINQHMVGPLMSLVGVTAVIATALNPIDLVLCVATLEEISPAAIDDFRRQVNSLAKNQRRRSVFGMKGGAMGVAALVSERVHPAAVQALRNRPMSFGSVVSPAIVDLGNRQLHIASNTPAVGLAMWHGVRSQARVYLPEPRLVLG